MPFQRVEKGSTGGQSQPGLTIYAGGNGRLTAAAVRKLDRPDAAFIDIGTGSDAGWMAVEPAPAEHSDSYLLSRDADGRDGADLSTLLALRDDAGVDIDALDSATRLDVEIDDDHDPTRLLVDISDLPGIDTAEETDPEPEPESEPEPDTVETETGDSDGGDKPEREEPAAEEVTNAKKLLQARKHQPWTDRDRDKRERLQLFVEGMLDVHDEPVQTTVAQLSEQVDAGDARGLHQTLRAVDGITVDRAGETTEGAGIWEVWWAEESDDEDDQPEAETGAWRDRQLDVQTASGPVTITAESAVDALADSPSKQRVQGALGVDRDGVEDLLATLDMIDHFAEAAPLRRKTVAGIVRGYLGVDDE